jgi:hypothetical protein
VMQLGSSSHGSWSDRKSSVHPQLPDSLLEAARGGRRTGRAGRKASTQIRKLDATWREVLPRGQLSLIGAPPAPPPARRRSACSPGWKGTLSGSTGTPQL